MHNFGGLTSVKFKYYEVCTFIFIKNKETKPLIRHWILELYLILRYSGESDSEITGNM